MDARINLLGTPAIGRNLKQLSSAGHLPDSLLPASTQELCRLRASQINGCGFCTDMHTKDALAAGEDAQRLHLVAAWPEATVFTEAERAAHAETPDHHAEDEHRSGSRRARPR